MKQITLLVAVLILVAGVEISVTAQKSRRQFSSEQVVADLYRQHKKRSPFFQHTNRALVDKYFEKELADLIWKDAKSAGDEVGALDGDPLFNAQEVDIKKFKIKPAVYRESYGDAPHGATRPARNLATVTVTFENVGSPHSIKFEMRLSARGWRVADISYDDGSRLSTILKQ